MGATEKTIKKIIKNLDNVEPTLKFLNYEQKQALMVLERILQLKPTGLKWSSNEYYFITILKFLLVPRTTIYDMYKSAPLVQVAQAYHELAPKFQLFNYQTLGITLDEYKVFVRNCYNLISDKSKWR